MTPRQRLMLGVLILAIGGSGYVALDRWVLNHGLPDGLIQANGRIEGDHVTVASKFPGRIQELHAREGAVVTAGEALIRLDDVQTRAKVDQAKHAAEALEAQVQAAHTTLAVMNLDVPLAIERAEALVAKANDVVGKTLSVEREARSDAQRFWILPPKTRCLSSSETKPPCDGRLPRKTLLRHDRP